MYDIAHSIIREALSKDPRTKNMRMTFNGPSVTLKNTADDESIAAQTDDDLRQGLGLPGTPIRLRFDGGWEGVILSSKRTKYVVERTRSRTGRGQPGKAFLVSFSSATLDTERLPQTA